MANPTVDAPVVPILLVGDAEVGKSAFLSYVHRHNPIARSNISVSHPC